MSSSVDVLVFYIHLAKKFHMHCTANSDIFGVIEKLGGSCSGKNLFTLLMLLKKATLKELLG